MVHASPRDAGGLKLHMIALDFLNLLGLREGL